MSSSLFASLPIPFHSFFKWPTRKKWTFFLCVLLGERKIHSHFVSIVEEEEEEEFVWRPSIGWE
jgi:hypothetical protein